MTVPNLFSVHGCRPFSMGAVHTSRAANFLEAFEPLPASGSLRFPAFSGRSSSFELEARALNFGDRDGHQDLRRSLSALLLSSLRLIQSRGLEPPNPLPIPGGLWTLFNFSLEGPPGRSVDIAFEDQTVPMMMGGVALEGPLGKSLELHGPGEGESIDMEIGWRSEECSVIQRLIVPPDLGRAPLSVGYFFEFQDAAVVALRRSLGMTIAPREQRTDPIESVMKVFADTLSCSGLFEEPVLNRDRIRTTKDHGLMSYEMESRAGVILSGAAYPRRERGVGLTETIEEVSLELPPSPSHAFRDLGEGMRLLFWNLGEKLALDDAAAALGVEPNN